MKEVKKIIENAGFATGSGMPLGGFYFFAHNKDADAAYIAVARGRMSMPGFMTLDIMFNRNADAEKMDKAREMLVAGCDVTFFKTEETARCLLWRLTLRKKAAEEVKEAPAPAPAPAPKKKKSTKTKKNEQK